MDRTPLLLVSLIWLLPIDARPVYGQVNGESSVPAWSARREPSRSTLRPPRARRVRPVNAESAVTPDDDLKTAENLRWRRYDESGTQLAQLPQAPMESFGAPPPQMPPGQMPAPQMPMGQMPAPQMPMGQMPAPQMPMGQMPPGQMPMGSPPPNGFSEMNPPAWMAPGYWQPNPMMYGMPGDPDCPPEMLSPYAYGPPCPPGPMMMPPPMPGTMPVPGPPPGAATPEPQYANVPLLPPNIMGSQFGAQPQLLTLSFENAFHTRGTIISGGPGSPAAVLAFERNGGFPNDFNSVPGTGRDVSGDGFTDTFNMTEPLPPNEVPTSPGPGYEYDGGTVSYTNSSSVTTAQDGQFQDNELWYAQYSFSKNLEIPAAGALSLRRMYVAQNNSPIPRNRVFFDYRYFKQARPDLGNVSWYTIGLEKTFNRERGSIESRLPFADTLDSEVFEDDPPSQSTEFGNINFTLKHILWGNERWLLSGGAGVSLPTGADTRVFLADGTEVMVIDNDAVHVQPFLALLWLPEEHFFVESFVSVDLDTRGNNVRGNIYGGRLPSIGEYRSESVLMADLAAGYWIYTNPSFRAAMQGIALAGEVNYQTTLENSDVVSGNGLTIMGSPEQIDTFSVTLGLHGYFFNQLSLSGGVGLPVSSNDRKEYDLAGIFMANWHF